MSFDIVQRTSSDTVKSAPQLTTLNLGATWKEVTPYVKVVNDTSFTTLFATLTNNAKSDIQFQVYDDKIYYCYTESVLGTRYLFTASSNIDGTGFSSSSRVSLALSCQMQIYNDKLYYVFVEGGEMFLAESELDGSGFTYVQLGVSTDIRNPQFQIVNDTVYYVFERLSTSPAETRIFTATSDIDGSNYVQTQQYSASAVAEFTPQFEVLGSKIYYVWVNQNSVYTATSDLDGSNFTETLQDTASTPKYIPQMKVVGSMIYYVWMEYDGTYFQISASAMNTDNDVFGVLYTTDTAISKEDPQFIIHNNKYLIAWSETTDNVSQLITATLNIDGSDFVATQRTTDETGTANSVTPQIYAVGNEIYFIWRSNIFVQMYTGKFTSDVEWKQATPYIKTSGEWKQAIQSAKV